ncbi:Transposase IS4 [Popillia japonica]|uniref:Transposase IS4 n=1 Tax=Popillia japonica TaxID=7064 RepID=A0AAW1JX64_POPJA
MGMKLKRLNITKVQIYTQQNLAETGKKNPFHHTRRLQRNILSVEPGITRYTSTANSIVEVFNLFVTTAMKQNICIYTNEEAQRAYNRYNNIHLDKPKVCKELTVIELNVYIGVLLMDGALHCRKESVMDMWSTDEATRRNIFTASIPGDRFAAISRFIRVDDKNTTPDRKETDKLAAIRDIWDSFVEKCTVRKNKADTPHELKVMANRPVHSSEFAFTKDITMVSYTPKKNRMVHLLSTQHFNNSISDEPHSKPIIVVDYNHTKRVVDTADKLVREYSCARRRRTLNGNSQTNLENCFVVDYNHTKRVVDTADKLVREYSCARRTLRWPFRLFMNILDIAALNAYIIFREKNSQWQFSNKSRKLFVEPNMKERLPNAKNIPHLQRALVACRIQIPTKEQQHSELETRCKGGHCILCPRAGDKKSKVRCSICSNFVCNEHRKEEKKIICLRRHDKDDSDD